MFQSNKDIINDHMISGRKSNLIPMNILWFQVYQSNTNNIRKNPFEPYANKFNNSSSGNERVISQTSQLRLWMKFSVILKIHD